MLGLSCEVVKLLTGSRDSVAMYLTGCDSVWPESEHVILQCD